MSTLENRTLADRARVLGQALRLTVGLTVTAALGLGMLTTPGCNTHGKYTSEKMSTAKIKMEGIKSATEYKMAEQAFLSGSMPKALKHIDHSISLNDGVAKSYVLRGRILAEMGDIEGAVASLQKGREIEPDNVDASYYMGTIAERIERREEALAHYLRASELDPTNPQYAIAAAEMMMDLGDIDRAEQYLTSHAASYDHNAGIRQTLGHIAMMKNDPATAVRLFSEARLLAPDDQNITEDLVRAQIATGKYAEAEYNLSRLLTGDQNKHRRDLQHMRASCLMLLDRPVEAREILIRLTTDPAGSADVEAWVALGQVAYVLRDYNRVKQCAARAIAIAPGRHEGYVLKALAQRKARDFVGAKKSIQTALSISRTSDNLVLLGMIQQDLKQHRAARLSFAEALRVNPNDPNAGPLLAAIESKLATVPE
jgi:tetratricopeptide (TPR) repeat protein